MNLEVTVPGTPPREFLDVFQALDSAQGIELPEVPNKSMSPFGGITAIPGMHTTAAGLAYAMNHNWKRMYGANAPVIRTDQAAYFLPGNPCGPVI
jgi:hypothetical protein